VGALLSSLEGALREGVLDGGLRAGAFIGGGFSEAGLVAGVFATSGFTSAGFAKCGFNDCNLGVGGFNPAGLMEGGFRDRGVVIALGLLIPDGFPIPLLGAAMADLTGVALRCGTALLASWSLLVKLPLILRRSDELDPMLEVLEVTREAGFALAEKCLPVSAGLASGLPKEPSLVPGLLPFRLALRLMLETGRGGGGMAIGLSIGLKKLERRRSFGVPGTD
jgi:hypothetical protein